MSIQDPFQGPYGNPSYPTPGTPPEYDPVTGAPYASAGAGDIPPAGGVPPVGNVPPAYAAAPYPRAGYVPPVPGAPNPALAGLLGFIPGVGAMYNGQFAKGIAHIVIFAVFESLASHTAGVFGLLVAGWEFYMAFEAYHTARARRDGQPLPDPFGLNNVGERFGFKGNPDFTSFWNPSGPPPPAGTPAPGPHASYQVDPAGNVYAATSSVPPQGAAYGSPAAGYPPPSPGFSAPGYAPGYGTGYGPGATGPGYPPVPPPPGYPPYAAGPYAPPAYGVPPVPPVRRNGLPVGALWLIGLGVFALLGSLHPFAFLEGEATGGVFLIGLSAFLFYRRQSASSGVYPAGSPGARWNLLRATRGAGAVFMVGLLTLLQGLHVIDWSSSWPLLLIVLGLLTLGERLALNGMTAAPFPGAYPGEPSSPSSPSAAPVAETVSPTSIVPKYTRPSNDLNDTEGR